MTGCRHMGRLHCALLSIDGLTFFRAAFLACIEDRLWTRSLRLHQTAKEEKRCQRASFSFSDPLATGLDLHACVPCCTYRAVSPGWHLPLVEPLGSVFEGGIGRHALDFSLFVPAFMNVFFTSPHRPWKKQITMHLCGPEFRKRN